MNIIAYFLHANAGFLRPVRLPTDTKAQFDAIHRLIGCDRVDIVKLWDDHHVFCDKNGLTEGLACFTKLVGHSRPIGGNLVVTGTNDDEDIVAPSLAIDAIASQIDIVRPVLDPDLEMINNPDVSFEKAFRPRLQRDYPMVLGETN